MGQKSSGFIGACLLGIALAGFAGGAAAQTSAEPAWRTVKAHMEAGPMLLGDTNPITVRLTGEPCNSRLVPVDGSGPLSSGALIRWREMGRASSQAVEGGQVVYFAAGFWFGFPPFEAGQTQRQAAAFDQLVQLCEQQPLPDGEPRNDRYAELETTFQQLKTQLDAVASTDISSRRFTYRVERSSTPCHFNVVKVEQGANGGWLDDKYITLRSGSRYSVLQHTPYVSLQIDEEFFPTSYLQLDTQARGQAVLGLFNQLLGLCTEFQASRG